MGTQPHKILLLVLTGLLLLFVLSGCGPEYLTEEQVKEETLDYLSSQYSAEFTVTAAEEKFQDQVQFQVLSRSPPIGS